MIGRVYRAFLRGMRWANYDAERLGHMLLALPPELRGKRTTLQHLEEELDWCADLAKYLPMTAVEVYWKILVPAKFCRTSALRSLGAIGLPAGLWPRN